MHSYAFCTTTDSGYWNQYIIHDGYKKHWKAEEAEYHQTFLGIGRIQMAFRKRNNAVFQLPVIPLQGTVFCHYLLDFAVHLVYIRRMTQACKGIKDIIPIPTVTTRIATIAVDGNHKVTGEHRIFGYVFIDAANCELQLLVGRKGFPNRVCATECFTGKMFWYKYAIRDDEIFRVPF